MAHDGLWASSIGVFVVILLGKIAVGVGPQIFYSIMFAEFPEASTVDTAFMSVQLVIRLFAGTMMLAFAFLWGWIIYRLSRPAVRTEFV